MSVLSRYIRHFLFASLLAFALQLPYCAAGAGAIHPSASAPHSLKQSVAVYMAGSEPSALRGAHKVIGSELAKALTESMVYSAVDRTEDALRIIEKEHIYQRSGAVDDEQIREIGKQLGVQILCIAEVNEVMNVYHLDVRIVDVETAAVISVASKSGAMNDVYQVAETAKKAARELVGARRKQ